MKILLLNQCFWPDVVATAQQLTVLARRLKQRGHQVTVVAGRDGYDDRTLTFPRHESWHGIEIIRVSSLSFGKKTRWGRTLNFASFLVTCAFQLITLPRQDVVIALTSPPLISWLGSLLTRLKGGQLIFWSMDLNPDEAIAAGWLKEKSFAAKFLSRLLRTSMHRARTMVALDRFMKERIIAKGIVPERIAVIPPAGDEDVSYEAKGREAFRRQHALAGKFVVMYAGNHSPCHPLDTLLAGANELKRREEVLFLFVGGGSEIAKVKEFTQWHQLTNILCLPYQPQATLSALLSAADLHVVVMGNAFVGIVHPSKIYNILSVGSPFIFIGPNESHLGEVISTIADGRLAMQVRHGESRELARLISDAANAARNNQHTRSAYPNNILNQDPLSDLITVVESAAASSSPTSLIEPVVHTSAGQV